MPETFAHRFYEYLVANSVESGPVCGRLDDVTEMTEEPRADKAEPKAA